MNRKPPRQDRQQTDDSLDTERKRTDEELRRRRARIEEDSDLVVSQARERADEVLARDRERADARRGGEAGEGADHALVAEERAREDRTIARERATADLKLEAEREERRKALASLLRFERETTDKHLLTERTSSDEALSSRDSFLGMVSHDLKTLLGGVALQASLLMRHASTEPQGEAVRQRAEAIQRFTARMNRLVGDLVDVTSIEAGKLGVSPRSQDATALLHETVEAFEPSAADKGIELMAQSDAGRGPVVGMLDRDRILQVLGNLVANAIKFTPSGGRISLGVERAGEEVRFCVRDTGPGVPASHTESIFERFGQVEGQGAPGLGLGLFISRCIVEAHQGRIWVESPPGEGSAFCFTVPAGD